MSYQEFSDDFWDLVAPLFERFKRRKPGGSKPLEFRVLLNGIFYLLKTGCQWAFLPSLYGSKSTVHEHFQRWASAGIFAEMFRLGADKYDELQGFKWDWQSMDGSLVQAPTRQATSLSEEGVGRNPTDRGKSGSKIHLLTDQEGMPCGRGAGRCQCPRQPVSGGYRRRSRLARTENQAYGGKAPPLFG